MDTLSPLPNTIWLMWSSGLAAAPPVVRACVDSWRRQHPAWRMEVVDRAHAGTLLDAEGITGTPLPDLDPVVLADLLRVHVLAEHGGVWVDATCFCARPLEQWLPAVMPSGFFAFRNPGPDRLLSTWFMAARPGHPLVQAWRDAAVTYWRKYRFPMRDTAARSRIHDLLTQFLSSEPRRNRWWFSWPVAVVLRQFPYFWLHYLFARILEQDAAAHALWRMTPTVDARAAHALQFEGNGLTRAMDEQTMEAWQNGASPVFKLSHKVSRNHYDPRSPLDMVINACHPEGCPRGSDVHR